MSVRLECAPGDRVTVRIARTYTNYRHPREGHRATVDRIGGMGNDLAWLRFDDGEVQPYDRVNLVAENAPLNEKEA